MLDFKKPTTEDKRWVDECLSHVNSMNCEYTFGNVFVWATAYSTEICHYKDFFICRWGKNKKYSYSLPLGQGDFSDAINAIIEDARENGIKAEIYGVTKSYLSMLREAFTGKFDYIESDDFSDYIYSVEKMATLSGKKYHSKRNHITNFKKNNPDWSFELISSDNISDCVDFHTKWIESKAGDSDDETDFSLEFEAVLEAFEHYEELGFVGGLIRVDGKVVAYTMGEAQPYGKCFISHFEKALSNMQGAYAIINQEFTKNCLGDYAFVNREEDLGIEGLRKAKQSYHPEILLEKCVAVYNG